MTNPKEKIVIRFDQWEAARAMLAALKTARDQIDPMNCHDAVWNQITDAIAQAEAAGITTGEVK